MEHLPALFAWENVKGFLSIVKDKNLHAVFLPPWGKRPWKPQGRAGGGALSCSTYSTHIQLIGSLIPALRVVFLFCIFTGCAR